ncbi:hypothetical protein YC2023_050063 [Brassica napus]
MGLVDSLFEKVPRKFSKGRCSPYESDVVRRLETQGIEETKTRMVDDLNRRGRTTVHDLEIERDICIQVYGRKGDKRDELRKKLNPLFNELKTS